MKRTALLIACTFLLYGVHDAKAANRFHVGGALRSSGTVRVEVNGGAGRRPQFRIGGGQFNALGNYNGVGRYGNVASRRAVASSYPVAVGSGGFGYGYGGYGGTFGQGGFSNLYNQGFIPVPPYYSLHPPVYYSVPVPRTYGYSPYAYPGYVPTPEVNFSEPEIIDNPHIQPEEAPAPAQETSAQTASTPVVIRNPFVEQADVVLTAQHVK